MTFTWLKTKVVKKSWKTTANISAHWLLTQKTTVSLCHVSNTIQLMHNIEVLNRLQDLTTFSTLKSVLVCVFINI